MKNIRVSAISEKARQLLQDRRGAVAMTFAMSLLPLTMLIGISIDMGRRNLRLAGYQSALDAATLAAAQLNSSDSDRQKIAQSTFTALTPVDSKTRATPTFTVDLKTLTVTGSLLGTIDTTFLNAGGIATMALTAKSVSTIARPQIRQLDLTFCIDATGSMQPTISAVQLNALNFDTNLNAELKSRNVGAVDGIRIRVIYYRDFGGRPLGSAGQAASNTAYYDPNRTSYVPTYATNGAFLAWSKQTATQLAADPNRYRYMGDLPPQRISPLYDLPASRTQFQTFVNNESAWGGADLPESGLECVNSAMDTAWKKKGDLLYNSSTAIEVEFPVIVVWTDADAHPPSHATSLTNVDYPPAPSGSPTTYAGRMPRSNADLLTKWNSANIIDQNNKLLVFFGDATTSGWKTVTNWDGFFSGGTLQDGNTAMVSKIADAVASKVQVPVLSQ